jgi:hypothetical protein
MLKKQEEIEEVFNKYKLLPQIVNEFTFEGTCFPVELITRIGRDLLSLWASAISQWG